MNEPTELQKACDELIYAAKHGLQVSELDVACVTDAAKQLDAMKEVIDRDELTKEIPHYTERLVHIISRLKAVTKERDELELQYDNLYQHIEKILPPVKGAHSIYESLDWHEDYIATLKADLERAKNIARGAVKGLARLGVAVDEIDFLK